jgi:3-phenylpropionate/trans-cinnamate dioxygenase ferredoxin component
MPTNESASTVRVRVCASDELAPGEAIQVPTTPPIAVFNVDGEFYATDDTCTHEESSLADGYIDGDQVECSFHFAKFCIRTGEALSFPATRSLATFPVIVEGGDLFVEVDDTRAAEP